MYIATIPNRNSPPAILLREGYREGGKVKNRTLANLSKLPPEAIEAIRRVLKGEQLVSTDELFEIVEDGSPEHGNVEAVTTTMRRLGFARLLCSQPSRQRDLVVAMVAARILEPQSKIATTRSWSNTTLADTLGVSDADEDDLYDAMDWLLERQNHIEKKLAGRHLESGGLALYDLTSSYFEGVTCSLAALGHNRDGKKGKLQVNYGLLASEQGIPVAVSVFEGNSGDPKTLLPQVDKMREGFGIGKFVLVGDRGMITQKQVDALREIEDVDWLTAMRPGAIRKLVEDGSIQMGLFDERNLFELEHPDWPGERLIACRNPELAARRRAKREALIEATNAELDKVRRMVGRGRLYGKEVIGDRIDKLLKQYKVGKHCTVKVRDDGFDYEVDEKALAVEVAKGVGEDAALAAKRLERYRRHIESIADKLDKIRKRTEQGRLHGKDEIGVRVGRVIDKYKVAKHFVLHIEDDSFDFEVNQEKVDAEAALDGIYVVRTSVEKKTMDTDQAVRSYKQLSNVERAFRCLKSVDLMVRPIWHRLEDRVRAHIFLCVLAYYVQWHMIEAWRPLLFADEDQQAKASRDPVAPAKRSEAAMEKVHTKRLEDGSPAHSFRTLLKHLGKLVRNTCRLPNAGPEAATFHKTTTPNAKQQKALDLLRGISV
ncbi:MAG: IS1634 family transposase [Gemmatimonadales bacterium]|jgi:transposase|nr:IS1634 family transposase [Gemmatimonadales bacterium]